MDSRYALWLFTIGVSPFGYPRIEAYLQLPVAYRSLSRPSSAPDAKAFPLCSYSLELSNRFLYRCSLNCLSFINKFFSGSILQLKVLSFATLLNHFHLLVKLYLPIFWKDQILIIANLSNFVLLNLFVSTLQYALFGFQRSRGTFTHLAAFAALPAFRVVGLDGLEPSTSRLSGARSNHLSYRPLFFGGH